MWISLSGSYLFAIKHGKLEVVETAIVGFLLFGLPLVVFPIGVTQFEIPKVFLAELAIFLLLLLKLLKLKKITWDWLSWLPVRLIGLIIGLSLIHLLFFSTQTTLFGNIFRLQGIFPLWLLLILALTSREIKLTIIPANLPLVVLIAVAGSVILFGTNSAGRAVGFLGEPNALAATAIFLWPWIYFQQPTTLTWKKVLACVCVIFVLILSGSRSGVIAFVIQLTLLVLMKRFTLAKSALVALGLFGLSLFLPLWERNLVFENRAEVWMTAWWAGWKNPILGNGFGNIESALRASAISLTNNLRFQYVDSSHNLLLDWWVQGGIIGVGLLLSLIFISFRKFIDHKKPLELVLILGLLTVMQFNPVSVVTLVGFWWLLGQGFKRDTPEVSS